ncbi:Hypothetical protein FNO222_1115 [Francisella orientalis]|uniref:Uncharacterized protein n=1 Tax=Francisella orientalis TaxID=299583 RepID=A0ABN4H5N0_9GAMM|nr:hypothetical protein FNO12_1106 [Francisella orientalis FNO12]AKN87269.1 Hypothetical protein FNO24_1108 [Francisella orientalis FNO24]AKN88806.1 Hypothetical protein FNO190_1106 [Francisella orientalis]AKU05564.1 Hypothetical protein FNO01_1106 [Francisella orientalis]QEN20477.1 Hypothetical protein FNO39_1115 [Francisella orientalis]
MLNLLKQRTRIKMEKNNAVKFTMNPKEGTFAAPP